MPLFGGSGGPKLKLTRPAIILMGVLGVLLVVVIILAIVLSSNPSGSKSTAEPPAATATIKVAEVETVAVPPTVQPTLPPAPVTSIPTAVPAETAGTEVSLPAADSTAIPAPTVDTGGGGVVQQGTPGTEGGEVTGEGAGELSQLPGGSSGLPWLIPLGVLLLVAVVWWRWRRARAEGR